MLRELLRELLSHQEDMEVVGEVLDPLEILYAVRETEADLVVTTLPESGEPGISSHLLAEYPELLVLAVSPRRNRARLYRQVVLREELSDTADEGLLSTIRRVSSTSRD